MLAAGGSTLDDLTRQLTFTVAVGNTDGHAKNLSFLRHDDGRTARLAPVYDVAFHGHLATSSGTSALDVAGSDDLAGVDVDRLVREAAGWGVPRRRATRVVMDTLERLRDALVTIDRAGHPGVADRAWQTVERRVEALLATGVLSGTGGQGRQR